MCVACIAGDQDPELTAAIAASLAAGIANSAPGPSSRGAQASAGGASSSYAAVAAQAAAAGTAGGSSGGWDRGGFGGAGGYDDDMEDDPELAAALAMSLEEAQPGSQQQQGIAHSAAGAGTSPSPAVRQQSSAPSLAVAAAAVVAVPEEPEEGAEGVLSLAVRLPSGQRLMRRFRQEDTVGGLKAWAGQQLGLVAGQQQQLKLAMQFPAKVSGQSWNRCCRIGILEKQKDELCSSSECRAWSLSEYVGYCLHADTLAGIAKC